MLLRSVDIPGNLFRIVIWNLESDDWITDEYMLFWIKVKLIQQFYNATGKVSYNKIPGVMAFLILNWDFN